MYKGHINDDMQDRLKAKLIEAILKFCAWPLEVSVFQPLIQEKESISFP